MRRATDWGCANLGHYAIDPHKIFPIHNGADPVKVFKGKKKFPEKQLNSHLWKSLKHID